MPPAVVALLPPKVVVQLFPGAVAQPYALQQHAVCSGLLLGGVQRLVASGGGVPSCLSLPCFQLPVRVAGALGCGEPGSRPHLAQAGRHMPCHLGATSSSLGCVGSLVASYSHVAGYPVESHPPPLRGEALEATQDGGDEAHVVAGIRLLESL